MRSILLLFLVVLAACTKEEEKRSPPAATTPAPKSVEELSSATAVRLVSKDRSFHDFVETGDPVRLTRPQLDWLRAALREDETGHPAACAFRPGIKVMDGPTVVLICLHCGEIRISGPDGTSEIWLGNDQEDRFTEWARTVFPDDPEVWEL